MARVVLVNGLPGAGKSSVARRVVEGLPLALLLDGDALRTALGQWERDPGSRLVARQLAAVLTEAHLRSGHDVVIPQYLGRLTFIEGLEVIATRAGATLVECVLDVPTEVAIERFRTRRAHLAEAGERHPERDLGLDDAVEAEVHAAATGLAEVLAARPGTHRIDDGDGPDAAAAAVLALVATDPPPS